MRKLVGICTLAVAIIYNLSFSGCKKDKPDGISEEFQAVVETIGTPLYTNCQATCYGLVGSDKGFTVTTRGFCYGTDITPTINDAFITCGAGSGSFEGTIINLMAATRYYVRAYATNEAGTSYGSTISFITEPVSAPVIECFAATEVTTNSARVNLEIISTGGTVLMQKGVCYSVNQYPSIEDSIVIASGTDYNATLDITALQSNTQYYFNAFATNADITAYGDTIRSFKTKFAFFNQVTDFDGNKYNTVNINGQEWMAENLKTIHLNDGTPIQYSISNDWSNNGSTPSYCYPYDDEAYDTLGVSYNFYCVNTQKLCPVGWHVPTTEEWVVLFEYVNYKSGPLFLYEGTNATGFSSKPSIGRDEMGYDDEYGILSYYWMGNTNTLVVFYPSYIGAEIETDTFTIPMNTGNPVRCIKN